MLKGHCATSAGTRMTRPMDDDRRIRTQSPFCVVRITQLTRVPCHLDMKYRPAWLACVVSECADARQTTPYSPRADHLMWFVGPSEPAFANAHHLPPVP